MANHIFFIDDKGTLQKMPEQGFENEDIFQKLLEDHPELLDGDAQNQEAAWLLVQREMDVPDSEDGVGRWSIDHLFLDREGVPTLVEVKRSSDTRIRREVIGQMLDYAANAVLYWPVERIRSRFEAQCEKMGASPMEVVAEFLLVTDDESETEVAVEAFWETVKTNIEAERIRLLFVADEIPNELQRIVEFLNGQMDPAEVLAIELKQYAAEGRRTLVPRTIGRTSRAERRKPGATKWNKPRKESWTEPELLTEIANQMDQKTADLAKEIIAWSRSLGGQYWGKGAIIGNCYPLNVKYKGKNLSPLCISSTGNFSIYLWNFREMPEFSSLLEEYLDRLKKIQGIALPNRETLAHKESSLELLLEEEALKEFKAIHEWFIPALKQKITEM